MPTLLHEFLIETAAEMPDRCAVIDNNSTLSMAQLDQASERVAAALQERGVNPGQRVALCLDNCAAWVIGLFGILRAGAVCVPIAPAAPPRKRQFILNDCGAAAFITDARVADLDAAQACLAKPGLVILAHASSPPAAPALSLEAIMDDSRARLRDPCLIDHDLATIIYTSGSAGEPKGVMLVHRNLVNSITVISTYLGQSADDVVCCALPLSHSYGLCQVLASVRVGSSLMLEPSFTFPLDVLRRMEARHATVLPAVPAMLARVLEFIEGGACSLLALRCVTNAAAALPIAHVRRVRRLLPQARLFSMYGLTECTRVSYLDPALIDHKPGSVGKAMPNCEAYVIGEDGCRAGPNRTGELVVRGANVMRGYWGRPDLTAQALRVHATTGDTILHPGDHFRCDADGDLYFVGRADQMFKCRGEKVSPLEIEHVLCELPGVVQAAVVGIDDPTDGMAIKATIVLRAGADVNEQTVRRHCRSALDAAFMPKYIEFTTSLPHTDSGKIDRRRLRGAPA